MRLFASALALAVLIDCPASAIEDEDAPRRVAIERLPLTGDHIEIGACVTRLMARSAKVQNYSLRDGVGMDWTPKTGLFMSAAGDPVLAIEFRKDDAGAFMTLKYRHPYSEKAAKGTMEKAGKTCLPNDWPGWRSLP